MSDCIEWEGGLNKDGYGREMRGGKRMGAHRWAWIDAKGEIADGLCVCHTCDNPACVNIDHLFLGTHKDNMDDRDAKGRCGRNDGEHNPRAKLTRQDAAAIRFGAGEGVPRALLADAFGVHGSQIFRIVHKQQWSN